MVFNHCYSPHIPTTSGYSSMLTGMDCFGTNVVALRHKGQIAETGEHAGGGPAGQWMQHYMRGI
ncbi:MAG: hypothetical protein ACLR23_27460 [Clostridia bacterium]